MAWGNFTDLHIVIVRLSLIIYKRTDTTIIMIILVETIDLIKSMNNNIFRKLYNVYQSPNLLSREIGSLKHNHSFKNSPLGIPHPLP